MFVCFVVVVFFWGGGWSVWLVGWLVGFLFFFFFFGGGGVCLVWFFVVVGFFFYFAKMFDVIKRDSLCRMLLFYGVADFFFNSYTNYLLLIFTTSCVYNYI